MPGFKVSHDNHLGSLHFYSIANGRVTRYTWDDADLLDEYDELESERPDKLLEIWNYKAPLSGIRLQEELLLFHSFVVIETERWWYSIEVSDKNILIQRSKCEEDVVQRREGKKRFTNFLGGHDWEGHEETIPGKTFRDVLEFLYRKDWLNQRYDFLARNCKDLARDIFEAFFSKRARRDRIEAHDAAERDRWDHMSWHERVHEINPDNECVIM